MTLVAEIGDISRFSSARKLCAWAGLRPQVRNSDTTVHHGHITVTKAGSALVRWVLDEGAQIAKRRPPFKATYESIRKRRGDAIATVAIVRRLLAQSFYILKEVSESQTANGEADRRAG
jgi:transposase